jgi:hypothetical protein
MYNSISKRRNLFIVLIFTLWLGAAALACGVLSPRQNAVNAEDLLMAAPAETASSGLSASADSAAAPVSLKSFR